MCEKHYGRIRKNGHLNLIHYRKKKYVQSAGYILLYKPKHTLANGSGYVYEHRYVLHKSNPEMVCSYCGIVETWKTCHVDHKDDSKSNNKLSNLSMSCAKCNMSRGMPKMIETHRAKHRVYTYKNTTLCLTEWAKLLSIATPSLVWRMKNWTDEDKIYSDMDHRKKESKSA